MRSTKLEQAQIFDSRFSTLLNLLFVLPEDVKPESWIQGNSSNSTTEKIHGGLTEPASPLLYVQCEVKRNIVSDDDDMLTRR